ncbi:hypothetical protein PTSG_10849 [Salpingoeca rosetta]|uniref:Tryptophan synthase beta chain-like PALP domain-containing protein n=1 Tax=Salpingoeca rosetta (strain ATCC 50818 / BSB-021) TaxID=946362 RepID=F2URJ8_SALR5|nr:uncharacterized protein PTSG_10849 [Salpingoeca rosetta]EGD80167.1 hypothetical protein PTSG_10849 [Salpingoeca rosetta]|eukprot:XP_004988229.1 hypothetical protein PTSG_10849 [Salpingoeca rosetta]
MSQPETKKSKQQAYCVGLKDVQAAQDRIKGLAHRTPLLTSTTMDKLSGRQLFFKCENLQRGGSFKIRGALNAVKMLGDDVKDVVTHSSGNHGQALALAASLLGKTAHIVMPDNAPTVKRAAVAGYGAKITTCESTQPAREAAAQAVLEGVNPKIEIIAAEPANADDCYRSMASDTHVRLDKYPAQRLVWERMKLVIEPSAGVSVAVALSDDFKAYAGDRLKKVAVVLCGGNQDLDKIPWVVNPAWSTTTTTTTS